MFKNRRFKEKIKEVDNDLRDLLSSLNKENISEHDRILTLEQIANCEEWRLYLIDNKKHV